MIIPGLDVQQKPVIMIRVLDWTIVVAASLVVNSYSPLCPPQIYGEKFKFKSIQPRRGPVLITKLTQTLSQSNEVQSPESCSTLSSHTSKPKVSHIVKVRMLKLMKWLHKSEVKQGFSDG